MRSPQAPASSSVEIKEETKTKTKTLTHQPITESKILKKVNLEDLQAACKAAGVRVYSSKNRTRLLEWIFNCPKWEEILSYLEAPGETEALGEKDKYWPSVEKFLNPQEEETEDNSWPWREEKPWFMDSEEESETLKVEVKKYERLSRGWEKYCDGLPKTGA